MTATRTTTTEELVINRARGYHVRKGITTNAEDWIAVGNCGECGFRRAILHLKITLNEFGIAREIVFQDRRTIGGRDFTDLKLLPFRPDTQRDSASDPSVASAGLSRISSPPVQLRAMRS